MGEEKDKVFWLASAVENKPYDKSTWYRCPGIQEFVKKVEETKSIVAVVFSGNNVGFIIEEKS